MEAETDIAVQPHETEDTRDRILAAAQRLFAEKGFDATSVRDITTEAGCNVASVNYHFGGKDNLYLETFRSMLSLLRDRRLEMMGELMARKPSPTLDEFVRDICGDHARTARGRRSWPDVPQHCDAGNDRPPAATGRSPRGVFRADDGTGDNRPREGRSSAECGIGANVCDVDGRAAAALSESEPPARRPRAHRCAAAEPVRPAEPLCSLLGRRHSRLRRLAALTTACRRSPNDHATFPFLGLLSWRDWSPFGVHPRPGARASDRLQPTFPTATSTRPRAIPRRCRR